MNVAESTTPLCAAFHWSGRKLERYSAPLKSSDNPAKAMPSWEEGIAFVQRAVSPVHIGSLRAGMLTLLWMRVSLRRIRMETIMLLMTAKAGKSSGGASVFCGMGHHTPAADVALSCTMKPSCESSGAVT